MYWLLIMVMCKNVFPHELIYKEIDKKKETLLFIEPTRGSFDLVITAQNLGYNTIIINAGTDDRVINNKALKKCNIIKKINTNDDNQVLEYVKLINNKYKINAVIPGVEYYIPLTAKIAELLKLKGLSHKAALLVTDKNKMMNALYSKINGVPKHKLVKTKHELEEYIKEIGFPCVLKPIDQAGSNNVKKVNNLEEAILAFQNIQKNDGCVNLHGDRIVSSNAMVSEYAPGVVYSVDGYIIDGKAKVVSISENFFATNSFVELGGILSKKTTETFRTRLESKVQTIATILDLQYCPYHLELKYDGDTFHFIEIAGRMSGFNIPKYFPKVFGELYYENIVKMYLGKELSPKTVSGNPIAIAGVYDKDIKRIRTNDIFINYCKKNPKIIDYQTSYKEGDCPPNKPETKKILGKAIIQAANEEILKNEIRKLNKYTTFR